MLGVETGVCCRRGGWRGVVGGAVASRVGVADLRRGAAAAASRVENGEWNGGSV